MVPRRRCRAQQAKRIAPLFTTALGGAMRSTYYALSSAPSAPKKWASVPSGSARPSLVFAFGRDAVSYVRPCEALSGLQQFNVEIASRLDSAFSISRTVELSAAEAKGCLARRPPPHTVTLHPAGSCNWPGGVIRSPFVRERSWDGCRY